jgi:signal transduction histidine kinase
MKSLEQEGGEGYDGNQHDDEKSSKSPLELEVIDFQKIDEALAEVTNLSGQAEQLLAEQMNGEGVSANQQTAAQRELQRIFGRFREISLNLFPGFRPEAPLEERVTQGLTLFLTGAAGLEFLSSIHYNFIQRPVPKDQNPIFAVGIGGVEGILVYLLAMERAGKSKISALILIFSLNFVNLGLFLNNGGQKETLMLFNTLNFILAELMLDPKQALAISGSFLLVEIAGIVGFVPGLDASERQIMLSKLFFSLLPPAVVSIFRNEYDKNRQETERQAQTEAELRKIAEKAKEDRENLMAIVTHELRTPMNAIIGFTDILLANLFPPNFTPEQTEGKRTELLERIKENGVRLLGLINNILDFSKLESGMEKVQIGEVNVKTEFASILNTLQPLIDKKKITCQLTMENCPEMVRTDIGKIKAILINLISNAIKFTDKEGSITVQVSFGNRNWQIQITDTGIGIPEDQLDKIFGSYEQVEMENKRKDEGTGLGLPIVKQYVDLMGGKITVQSQLEVGSTFTVTLPINLPEHSKDKAPSKK